MTTLNDVEGVKERRNNVVYQKGTTNFNEFDIHPKHLNSCHVIYFPGDVQDYESEMVSHPQNNKWKDWSYEKTIEILHNKFPKAHIWLIIPKKNMYKTFSIFSNFIKIESLVGVPTYTTDHMGLLHLEKLLDNAVKLACTEDVERKNFQNLEITLIGFSKGCNVLNQFLYEASNLTSEDQSSEKKVLIPLESFFRRITDMYWLDGGHSGNDGVWITDSEIVKSLTHKHWNKNLKIHVNVTPYQIKDPVHPWKGDEEKEFISLLKYHKINLNEQLFFDREYEENEKPSLHDHFQILKEF